MSHLLNQCSMISGLVSIIVPVYNKREYIEECFDYISKQTYSNYEAIIIDDGSTDGSADVCDAIAQKYPWARVIHKQNGGVSSARNIGIREARGEWICFVDADDHLLPNMLDTMVKENAALVVCNWSDENRKYCSNKFVSERQVCTMKNDDTLLLCTPDFFKTIWNKLFRLDIIKNNNIWYEEDICHAEDSLFAIDYYSALGENDRIVLLQEPLYFHRSDVKGSLIKDHNIAKWRMSASYWWKHIESANLSTEVKNDMLVRCIQNEFLVYAMEGDYKGLKKTLREKSAFITKDTIKYWPKIKQFILLSKNAFVIYMANRIWRYFI